MPVWLAIVMGLGLACGAVLVLVPELVQAVCWVQHVLLSGTLARIAPKGVEQSHAGVRATDAGFTRDVHWCLLFETSPILTEPELYNVQELVRVVG